MKERVTITLEQSLLHRIDRCVDGTSMKNRSHAIEMLLSKSLGEHVPTTAVILAGGEGTRLRPITYEIPKALLPVHDKTLTEHLFDLLRRHGITKVILAVGHMREKIMKHYGDGKRFGMSVSYVEEKTPLGTAGPLRLLQNKLTTPFIVSNGDELKDINIEEMYRVHKNNKALVTIALTTVQDPSAYGVARLSGARILEFVEKPSVEEAPSNLISSGFYIFEPEVINLIPKKGFCMLEKKVFPKLAKKGKLFGYPFSGQWFDTGTHERYEKALKEWRDLE